MMEDAAYRFVYNKTLSMMKIGIGSFVLFIFSFLKWMAVPGVPFSIFLVAICILIAVFTFSILFLDKGKSFILDAEGIRFSFFMAHPRDVFPTCQKWSEFKTLQYFTTRRFLTGTKFLLLRDKNDKGHLLCLRIKTLDCYIGENHAFSFEELSHRFSGPIEEVPATRARRIFLPSFLGSRIHD
jgi:hypothetical protein